MSEKNKHFSRGSRSIMVFQPKGEAYFIMLVDNNNGEGFTEIPFKINHTASVILDFISKWNGNFDAVDLVEKISMHQKLEGDESKELESFMVEFLDILVEQDVIDAL